MEMILLTLIYHLIKVSNIIKQVCDAKLVN